MAKKDFKQIWVHKDIYAELVKEKQAGGDLSLADLVNRLLRFYRERGLK